MSREAWGPVTELDRVRAGDGFGKFGKMVREKHDPLWRLEADCGADLEQAERLADEIVDSDFADPRDVLLYAAYTEILAVLRILRERLANDPARLVLVRELETNIDRLGKGLRTLFDEEDT